MFYFFLYFYTIIFLLVFTSRVLNKLLFLFESRRYFLKLNARTRSYTANNLHGSHKLNTYMSVNIRMVSGVSIQNSARSHFCAY